MKISRIMDFSLLANLNQHVHNLHVKWYPHVFKDYNAEAVTDAFKKLVDQENQLFFLLEDTGQPIGYAWIEIRTYPETVFKQSYQSIYVHQISIDPKQQKKGYGAKLMEAINNTANEKEIGLIELDYWSENEEAKHFYQKQGFKLYREFVYKEL